MQTAHLLELFGKTKYREAEPLLRRYIPKEQKMGTFSRTAAIWSLGYLHEGVPDEALARLLVERLNDIQSSSPRVRPDPGDVGRYDRAHESRFTSCGVAPALSSPSSLRKTCPCEFAGP